jgi:hypothetical protein
VNVTEEVHADSLMKVVLLVEVLLITGVIALIAEALLVALKFAMLSNVVTATVVMLADSVMKAMVLTPASTARVVVIATVVNAVVVTAVFATLSNAVIVIVVMLVASLTVLALVVDVIVVKVVLVEAVVSATNSKRVNALLEMIAASLTTYKLKRSMWYSDSLFHSLHTSLIYPHYNKTLHHTMLNNENVFYLLS